MPGAISPLGRSAKATGRCSLAARSAPRSREGSGAGFTNGERSVEAPLGRFEAFGVERLDRVCGARDDPGGVLVGLEVRQNVVSQRAAIAPPGAPHSDPEPHEVVRAEL